ncbi:MAG: TonB-dependent receptor [Luteimonas sp.]
MSNLRRSALASAVQATLFLALPAVAAAQDAGAPNTTELDRIEVTGTRIKRTDLETSSPTFQIDREAIDNSGALTIGEFLQDVPSMAGAATNPTVNNGGGSGAATVSLRGLGEVRTLILINGRRVVTNDVNSIPLGMVERVEVLKDGASSTYGSDAIGGVVNFILKKNFSGVQTTLNYGISDHQDGQRQGVSSTLGLTGDRGNIIITANYNKQEEVKSADRDYSKFALTLYAGAVTIGGSSRTTNGRYAVPESLAGLDCNGDGDLADSAALTRIEGQPGTAISDFRCFDTRTDLFNYQAVGNLQLTPQERSGLFVSGNYDITENVHGYLDAFVNKTRSRSAIAPLPFDGRPANDNIVLSADSIFNPFGIDIIDSRLRLSRIGNRTTSFTTDVSQFTGGLKGAFGDSSWDWDVNASFGKIKQNFTQTGYLLTSALNNALGPSFIDGGGTPTCGTPTTPIPNCVPVDFFGAPPDPATPQGQAQLSALALIAPTTSNITDQNYRDFQANFDGDLFDVPAGTVQGAFGVEYRRDTLNFAPDFLAVINLANFTCLISSEACTSPTRGSVTTKEVYGELLYPVLKDVPFAKSLDLTLGVRWSDYDTFGSTTNGKLGVEWRINDQLLFRSTYAQVFRAPRIVDLFSGQLASSDTFGDPCNGYTGQDTPACTNVPTDGSFGQTDTQLSAFKGGNPNLKPEQGSVFTWGVVYEPSWLDGFSTTLDVWRVQLDNTIATYGTQTILNNCFRSTTAAPSPFCPLFSRDANGEIIRLFDINANVGETRTNGVDFGIRYRVDTPWGNFRTSIDSTYVAEYDVKLINNGIVVGEQNNAGTFLSVSQGGLGNYSRVRSLGVLNWTLGNWDAQWTSRFISGFKVGSLRLDGVCASLALPQGSPGCQFSRGANTYHNVQLGYSVPAWKTKFRVGVDNLFDKQPPIVYQNNSLNGNTDERTFDTVGRYFWTTATVTF